MYHVMTIPIADLMHEWFRENHDARWLEIEMAFRSVPLSPETDATTNATVGYAVDVADVRERLAACISRHEIETALGRYMTDAFPSTYRLVTCSFTADALLGTATFIWASEN